MRKVLVFSSPSLWALGKHILVCTHAYPGVVSRIEIAILRAFGGPCRINCLLTLRRLDRYVAGVYMDSPSAPLSLFSRRRADSTPSCGEIAAGHRLRTHTYPPTK